MTFDVLATCIGFLLGMGLAVKVALTEPLSRQP